MQIGSKRQGHLSAQETWRNKTITSMNLPNTIQMGEENAFKRQENIRVTSELLWQHAVSQALISATQPETYEIACKNIRFLCEHGEASLAERIEKTPNPIIPSERLFLNCFCKV